jgi:hypothetical protein
MKISRVSIYEYITINATIRQLYKKDNCQSKVAYIRNRFQKYDDCEQRVLSWQKSNGCIEKLNRTVDRIDNIKFNKCTCLFNNINIDKLIQMSELLKVGILPFKGALMDQPAQIMEILDVVSYAKHREVNLRKDQNG